MKKWIALPPLILFALFAAHFSFHFGQRFHPQDFEHGFEKSYKTEISGQDPTLLPKIFAQPFHFLGQGKQMTAFVSADDRYVIKFFNPMRPLKKNWIFEPKYILHYCSLKWISREWLGKKRRLHELFERHKIAFESLKVETGLVYLHFSDTDNLNQWIELTDRSGKKHLVALHNTPFVLQEKAELVPKRLSALLAQGDKQKAAELISSLEGLFRKRAEAHITDRIQTVDNNYGFVGDRAIQIDVGRIRIDQELEVHAEVARILDDLHQWIGSHFTEMGS